MEVGFVFDLNWKSMSSPGFYSLLTLTNGINYNALSFWALLLLRKPPFLSLTLILTFSPVTESTFNSQCTLRTYFKPLQLYKSGDIVFGGIMQYMTERQMLPNFCTDPFIVSFISPEVEPPKHHQAFIFTIEEINQINNILPNITLGYSLYDSANYDRQTTLFTLLTLSGGNKLVPNYECGRRGILAGFIGDRTSDSSYVMSVLTGLYFYPQISYGSTDTLFSDRLRFPSVYQTVPNEKHQNQAVIQLLKHFGWTWVGILTTDDDASKRASEDLKDQIIMNGMCVEFVYHGYRWDVRSLISKASAKVVIVSTSGKSFYKELGGLGYYRKDQPMGKTWIFTSASLHDETFPVTKNLEMLNGSLIFSLIKRKIPGLKEFVAKAFPRIKNIEYKERLLYECKLPGALKTIQNLEFHWDFCKEKSNGIESRRFTCSGNETLPLQPHHDLPEYKIMYSIYKAVYALAYGLHGLLLEDTSHKSHTDYNQLKWKLKTRKTPRSVCSECSPGYRKAPRNVQFTCCYDCVHCSEGHISNTTDMENCIQCPEDKWPNDNRTVCIQRTVEFLSYNDLLGQSLATLSVILSLKAILVLQIFIKHHKTPVVKANNQTLSYILLFSLTLSFLCCFLFIGHPEKVTCLLRQVTFGINFTISVSCVLAKSVTVVIAFNATKPGSKIKKWFIVAFLVRKLPASFNEAQLITFSMLVFCSVWVSFIPAYLSTKGKYMVAVEIFAILASSAGLLGCIFIPKCYIILFHPEQNSRRHITGKL
ncbi:hypothetical protein GDO86_004800 [Hymenochirus boettgeri]|uniref:G-protein coupled receptors family 3 profile domain-containing protein n=1 Tax=Hymenochirus boettgeri TaxID=247094 RepID=A0A8T2KCJ6_9PIPI|nr:hypothetical protein GDO86_004800 [Hymenochirus boettgeri]